MALVITSAVDFLSKLDEYKGALAESIQWPNALLQCSAQFDSSR